MEEDPGRPVKDSPKNHVRRGYPMNQFIFGIIIGAILVIVLVGIIYTAYRWGQRSQFPTMLPSDKISPTESDKGRPQGEEDQIEQGESGSGGSG